MSREYLDAIDAAIARVLIHRSRSVLKVGGPQGQPEDAKAFLASQDTIEALQAARDGEEYYLAHGQLLSATDKQA